MVTIRKESPADAAAIEAVTVAAFRDAAHSDHTEQFIVSALRGAGQLTVSLVAQDDGAVIGHVAVSPVGGEASPRWPEPFDGRLVCERLSEAGASCRNRWLPSGCGPITHAGAGG